MEREEFLTSRTSFLPWSRSDLSWSSIEQGIRCEKMFDRDVSFTSLEQLLLLQTSLYRTQHPIQIVVVLYRSTPL